MLQSFFPLVERERTRERERKKNEGESSSTNEISFYECIFSIARNKKGEECPEANPVTQPIQSLTYTLKSNIPFSSHSIRLRQELIQFNSREKNVSCS